MPCALTSMVVVIVWANGCIKHVPPQGSPEDLLFFYKLLSAGVKLLRVDLPLLVYRFHEYSTTSDITEWVWAFTLALVCICGMYVWLCMCGLYVWLCVWQGKHLGAEGVCSPGTGFIQMDSFHYLECWKARSETLPLSQTREPGKGNVINILPKLGKSKQ